MAAASKTLKNFQDDEGGAVAIMFGLMIIVCATMAGLAIDYSRILMARKTLMEATDSAALATGRALIDGNLTVAQAEAMGQAYFTANAKDLSKANTAVPTATITADPDAKLVSVSAQITVPMTLMAITGFKTSKIDAASKVSFDAKDLEVGMALDITGSMADSPPGGGGPKIDALKFAFERFATTLIPSSQQIGRKVRIGVAPYDMSVDLTKYAAAATNSAGGSCVVERINNTFTDLTPSGGGYFYPSPAGCPNGTMMPLTDDKAGLISHVKTFFPGRSTAGHIGLQWGWNMIAEDYASFWGGAAAPDAYSKTQGSKPTLVKAVIWMTDGQNNTQWHGAGSDTQAKKLCDAMKAKGVLVFTIGFGLGNSGLELTAKNLLKSCATPGAQYFADVQSSSDLDVALQSFASTLGKLRVSQ